MARHSDPVIVQPTAIHPSTEASSPLNLSNGHFLRTSSSNSLNSCSPASSPSTNASSITPPSPSKPASANPQNDRSSLPAVPSLSTTSTLSSQPLSSTGTLHTGAGIRCTGLSSETPEASEQTAWWSRVWEWIQTTIGIITLIVTLIAFFVYEHRAYRMGVWADSNDLFQSCLAGKQDEISWGPVCEKRIAEGPTSPPYRKRDLFYKPGIETYKFTKRSLSRCKSLLNTIRVIDLPSTNKLGATSGSSVFSQHIILLVVVSLAFTVGGCVIVIYWRRSNNEAMFSSPARSEASVKITRHYAHGPETVSSEQPVKVTRHHIGDGSPFEGVRRRTVQNTSHHLPNGEEGQVVPGWQPAKNTNDNEVNKNWNNSTWEWVPHNSSASTLINGWTGSEGVAPSKVSVDTGAGEQHHEGLIELKTSNATRNFLDPDTGEVLHLSPWKSTHDNDPEEENSWLKQGRKGTIRRAIANMSVGSASLTSGKAVGDVMISKLEVKDPPPQHAGDSLAGLVTNER